MTRRDKKVSDIGEFGLIDWISRYLPAKSGVVKSIGDDTAVLLPPKGREKYLLFTTDMTVEHVHFTRAMGARNIGRKSLARNLSDIAAMGGVPTYAVVSLGVPSNLSLRFVQDLYSGMKNLARKFHVNIVGGDTTKSSKIMINIALLGEVEKRHLVLRSGAHAGDKIFVTEKLGRSLLTKKHLNFEPRLKESQYLVKNFKLNSMIDISDGLAADLGHILDSSNVGALIDARFIPRTPGASLNQALYDGEDYELLFTLSTKEAERLKKVKLPFRFYEIGKIAPEKNKLQIVDEKGRMSRLSFKGFTHF